MISLDWKLTETDSVHKVSEKGFEMAQRIRFAATVMLFSLLQLPAFVWADEVSIAPFEPKGKVSGYAFGDWFYNMKNSDSTKRDLNAIQFRRIYLYYDYDWSEAFAAQFLLEADGKDTTNSGKLGVFVKAAYLEWKELVPKASLYIGMSATPTWSTNSEKVWTYRSIEKTIIDLHGLGSASDLGIGLKGKFDSAGRGLYHIMLGNGRGQKPEDNKYKKIYGDVIFKPTKDVSLEAYADYEGASKYAGSDRRKDVFTLKGCGAYQTPDLTIGVEAFRQTKNNAGIVDTDTANVVPTGIALFVHGTLMKDKLRGFARFDIFDPDANADDATERLLIAGFDYMPNKNIHVMPNILINDYFGDDLEYDRKESDITARVTFYYIYK